MAEKFNNLARSTLANSITAASGNLTVVTGDGNDLFPVLNAGDYFRCVLFNKETGDIEIVNVTSRAGDVFLINRAVESIGNQPAVAYAFNAGDLIELRPTKGFYESLADVSVSDIQSYSYNYGIDTGVVDQYVVAITPPPAGYTSPGRFMFLPNNTNTGASSLQITGVGIAQPFIRPDGSPLEPGDIVNGQIADVVYEQGGFVLLNPRSRVLPRTWEIVNLSVVKSGYFDGVVNNGTVTTSPHEIDWTRGNKQTMSLDPATGTNIALNFVPPLGPTDLTLTIRQTADGNRTITWPSGVKFIGGNVPVLSTAPSAVDIAKIYWDGGFFHIVLAADWRVV